MTMIDAAEEAWERRRKVAIATFGQDRGDAWHRCTRARIESIGAENELPAPDIIFIPLPKPTLFDRICLFLGI